MNRNCLRVILVCICLPAYASGADKPYRAPRLPDGHMDMQGTWKNSDLTPLERPKDIVGLEITAQDAARLKAEYLAPATAENFPDDPGRTLEGRMFEPIRGRLRSSVIVDPSNGKIPWNESYRGQSLALRGAVLTMFDDPERRPAIERCLSSNGAPPILPNGDNNTYEVVQTNAATVIVSEFVHDARIIRMNSTHSPAQVTSWLGDSIGWWEADTLVVETKYFAPSSSVRLNQRHVFLVSPMTTVVERFTRVSNDEINYVFSVTDPTYYTVPWKGEAHFTRTSDRMFEMACHEGNYSLRNILEAARIHE
jgi:hypothetical protein